MQERTWTSYHDDDVVKQGYPVVLRRIGDPKSYKLEDWPHTDEESKLMFDSFGPFGHAVRFNKGYIFAEVPRSEFDRSPLDIHGRQPFRRLPDGVKALRDLEYANVDHRGA